MAITTDILVIGAGMVGASAALQLRMRGREVTLVDRQPPGEETSYGNAGVIVGDLNFQVAFPRNLSELARLALNRTTYFRYNPAVLPRMVPWLWRFWRASSPTTLNESAHRSRKLFAMAVSEHLELARQANVLHLLRNTGWLHITRQKDGLASTARERRLADEFGFPYEMMTADDIADLEPSLQRIAAAGVYWSGAYHTGNPSRLTKAYANAVAAAGGTLVEASVTKLRRDGGEGWLVETSEQAIKAREVVITAGPWSRDLLTPLGYRIPFEIKRGYHQHFTSVGQARLTRPVKDNDYGFVIAPMEQGIRLTTGVEFDHANAPPSSAQLQKVLLRARELFPLTEPVESEPWLGQRPTFPDQLPMIGRAPGHDGLWFNFGHAHWGLTLGPATGRLLAEMMCAAPLSADPEPFSPARF